MLHASYVLRSCIRAAATYNGIMRFLKNIGLFFATMLLTLAVYDTWMPPVSMPMMARVFTLHRIHRSYVPLRKISPALARAVIAAEDGKFCTHYGVDWKALGNVVEDLSDDPSERPAGASTITMQTTKNLFLWNGRSYVRKAIEIPMALLMDALWSKRRIMENYLNIAEFGRGIYGAEAAARHYFHKSARALTSREAALLAATLPNPKRRNPARPSGYHSGYASSIAARAGTVDSSCLR